MFKSEKHPIMIGEYGVIESSVEHTRMDASLINQTNAANVTNQTR